VSSHLLTVIGTLASGGGTIALVVYYVRLERKRANEECERRFAALREGMRIGKP
jgi:hypothetical protein